MHGVDTADREFLTAFEACQLSGATFAHRDHVRLAYIYLTLHPPDVALHTMRAGLQRLLAHLGAPASKYHETITRAWILAVHHFMQAAPGTTSFDEFAARAPRLFDKEIMQTHYTLDLLMSDEARRDFVEPDLQPIPRHTS